MSVVPLQNHSQRYALTPAQIDIWLEQTVHPHSTSFILSYTYPMPVALDVDRFLAAANWVLSHYDALYARLVPGHGDVPEVLLDPKNAVQCEYLDFSGAANPQDAMWEFVIKRAHTPFVMLNSSLSRPALMKMGEASFCYYSSFHHIMVDGWGTGIVFSRMADAYEKLGKGIELQVDGGSFADYLRECRNSRRERSFEKAIEFWKPLMASPIPSLPVSHISENTENEPLVSFVAVTLPRQLADRVSKQAAATSSATLYHALLLAYSYLINKLYSIESNSLSLPILNRSKEHKETIGYFTELRTVPLPLNEEDSMAGNLNAISRRIREVFRHYHLPNSELHRLYQSQGNSGAPVSHSTISYITRDFGASIEGVFIPMNNLPSSHSKLPFTVYALDIYPGKDIRLELVYQLQHMNRDEAELFLQRWLWIMESFAENPNRKLCEIDLLPPQERKRIAAVLRRDSERVTASRPIICDILERSRICPDAIAVESVDQSRSYRECIEAANAIARSLVQECGVQPGDRVALLLPRSADLISSELAVMMVGGTFVPIDSLSPEHRARQIIEDSGAKCLISISALSGKAHSLGDAVLIVDSIKGSSEPFAPRTDLDQIAYMIYTSGSTGRPKGVEISQRALAEHIASLWLTQPLGKSGERHLFFHSPAFDACIETVFPPLMRGDTLVTAPSPQWTVYELGKIIVERRLNVLNLPPAYLLEFLRYTQDKPEQLAGHQVRLCQTGGETMHAETAPLWDKVFGQSSTLLNIYGPTECAVTSNAFPVPRGYLAEPGESIPIGKPHKGRALRIVDKFARDVPICAEGELLIGGIGLANGYHNLPEETARRFITLDDGMRYYRSGDIVRLKSDGNILFRHRLDNQVKVRGFRIELEEIEACLMAYPAVNECAVLVKKGGDGSIELIACVALVDGSLESRHSLRAHLLSRLPAYMVPSILIMDKLPRGISEKIDRDALSALQINPELSLMDDAPIAPLEGAVQEYLGTLWEQSIGRKVLDAKADFFESGGHSLLAASLISKISKSFRVDYPFSAFFDKPSIAEVERKLEQLVGDKAKLEKIAKVRMELARLSPEEIKARLESVTRKNSLA